MHVVVLHLIFGDHQAHAPCWIESYSTVNGFAPIQRTEQGLVLTDTSIPRLRRGRRQRREAESYTDKYRAQCRTECLALARIETNSKGEEDQAKRKHEFEREQLSGRDLSWVDCAAWNGALKIFSNLLDFIESCVALRLAYDGKILLRQPQLQPISAYNRT